VELKGEDAACREMRKHFVSYVKGIPGSARFRALIVQARTRDEYRRIAGDFLRSLPEGRER